MEPHLSHGVYTSRGPSYFLGEHETSLARFLFNSFEMDEIFGHMHHLDSEFVTMPETTLELATHGQFHFWIAAIVLWKWEGAKTFGHVW